ncbi:MAG: ribonuclease III family protein, partial [Stenotrophobium sp.]
MSDRLARLSRLTGHEFRDQALLEQALTHRSFSHINNERLEFLGDGLINFIIAAALYEARPKAEEGALSRLRASLVREESLARIARGLELGDALRLGESELKSGGFRRDSIIADALEA